MGTATHYDVDALAGAGGPDDDGGLLVGDEHFHQRCVAHRVLRGHDDLVELHVLGDGTSRLQLIGPQLPPAWTLVQRTWSCSETSTQS